VVVFAIVGVVDDDDGSVVRIFMLWLVIEGWIMNVIL